MLHLRSGLLPSKAFQCTPQTNVICERVILSKKTSFQGKQKLWKEKRSTIFLKKKSNRCTSSFDLLEREVRLLLQGEKVLGSWSIQTSAFQVERFSYSDQEGGIQSSE